MACSGSGVRVPPAPPTLRSSQRGTAKAPLRPDEAGALLYLHRRRTDEDGVASMTITHSQARTAIDGRGGRLRPPPPTDSRALASLFAAVRREGRWLVTPASAVSEPSEAFFIGEMIRDGSRLAIVAEGEGGGGG